MSRASAPPSILIPFTKMHGLGNDFVVIDERRRKTGRRLTPELARKLCDRRLGIGADQVLILRKASRKTSDFRMDILNADGSVAEMCGNGIRAVAMYHDRRVSARARKRRYAIETLAGVKSVEMRARGLVCVDMGPPGLGAGKGETLPGIDGLPGGFFEVSMGNPHAVFFVDQVAKVALERLGAAVETHPRFPKRTNAEFVEVTGQRSIRVRVWERGAGVTLACGTGACASAVAAIATGRVGSPVAVELPGGVLTISWDGNEKRPVFMEGPAVEIFSGEFYLKGRS